MPLCTADYRETIAPSQQGEIFGTLKYLAPGGLLGLPIDARADVYSIGELSFDLSEANAEGQPADQLHHARNG